MVTYLCHGATSSSSAVRKQVQPTTLMLLYVLMKFKNGQRQGTDGGHISKQPSLTTGIAEHGEVAIAGRCRVLWTFSK